MVWSLILLTALTYAFVMKHVLSNVMKDQNKVEKVRSFKGHSRSFVQSKLIPTETTR
ncbi:hypothetical protein [Rossellomorea aquimaris]|uniref:hypothetical protein n=1 Tax=Rossellomorea aquimaris TaxID=189382 RepID=UPI000AE075B9|nr:hypothetical protein [Rossellomorea aquimaris]